MSSPKTLAIALLMALAVPLGTARADTPPAPAGGGVGVGASASSAGRPAKLPVAVLLERVADLRAFADPDVDMVDLLGWHAPSDGGGGRFFVDTRDTVTQDDGGLVFIDAAGRRWRRWQAEGTVNASWFGAMPSTPAAANREALQKAIDAVVLNPRHTTLKFDQPGNYDIDAALLLRGGVSMQGLGARQTVIRGGKEVRSLLVPYRKDVAIEDLTIEAVGFDMAGYNERSYGGPIVLNMSNGNFIKRVRVRDCAFFDTNYPGDDAVNQRLMFIDAAKSAWIEGNEFEHGIRIKIGGGGEDIWIVRNVLNFINDNAITMAMSGTLEAPGNEKTARVNIHDNLIRNPRGVGIFLGGDGDRYADPTMSMSSVIISRNIVEFDSQVTEGNGTRGIQILLPSGGSRDIVISDNIIIQNGRSHKMDRGIGLFAMRGTEHVHERIIVRDNVVSHPQDGGAYAIYVSGGETTLRNLTITGNILQGYGSSIALSSRGQMLTPVIRDNVVSQTSIGFRLIGDPFVSGGSYVDNRIDGGSPSGPAVHFSSENAMDWIIKGNAVRSEGGAVAFTGKGRKDILLIDNDFRGSGPEPVTFLKGATLSPVSERRQNAGDAVAPSGKPTAKN